MSINDKILEKKPGDSPRPGPKTDPACRTCNDTGECFTCGGTGLWYRGTIEEEECSSCGGHGHCPDCLHPR